MVNILLEITDRLINWMMSSVYHEHGDHRDGSLEPF
jgi:hypothetical protein